MSHQSAIRPKHYREKVFFRKLRTQVDGSAKVEHGLTQVKGVGRRLSQAIVRIAGISPDMRIGAIPEKELNRLEEIILDPGAHGVPSWMLNRNKDLRTGNDLHIIGNQLEITIKRDIDRHKRIKSYRGIRHQLGLKVRGQRTKSTGRHGLVVGVLRRKLKKIK
jgi:small subunit ribosomal protein S13